MTTATYRKLTGMTELLMCTQIEQRVWGEGIVPTHLLKAVSSMGGLVVGAFVPAGMVGFTFGFLGRRGDELLHHSHVLAVLPEWSGQGIGEALKRKQAELCRAQGLKLMTWTFDPLRARNAHLNLEKLGVVVRRYEADYYGDMTDAQNGQLASDRLLAEWQLDHHGERWSGEAAELPAALAGTAGGPGEPDLTLDAAAVHVAVPRDVGHLLETDPEQAGRWRQSVRQALSHYLMRGFTATRFTAGGYVLERN